MLASLFRALVRHDAGADGPKDIELLPDLGALVPPAAVVGKHRYSPFTDSGLLDLLREWDAEALVVTGAETEVCVLATVLGAVDPGFRVVVATDAVCSAADSTHDAMLTVYRERFGQQIEAATADVILANWSQPGLPCTPPRGRTPYR